MSEDIERILVKKAVNGDTEAFEALVYQYEKKVYNICYRYLRNEEDAKDNVQNVFIKVYKNLKSFNYASTFSTWIYKITYNTCIDEIRKRKNKLSLSIDSDENAEYYQIKDESPGPEAQFVTKEGVLRIEAAINQLEEHYKSVIILRELNGLSYQQIADITDTSLGTVKSRLARARTALAQMLRQEGEQNEKVSV